MGIETALFGAGEGGGTGGTGGTGTPNGDGGGGGIQKGLILSGVLGAVGSIMTISEHLKEASALRQQGDIAYQDYMVQAAQMEEQARQFEATQTMQYAMSGVSLQGTPLQVLDYTRMKSKEEVSYLRSRAVAERDLARTRASREAMGGIAKGLSRLVDTGYKVYKGYDDAKNGGIFDSEGTKAHALNPFEGETNVFTREGRIKRKFGPFGDFGVMEEFV